MPDNPYAGDHAVIDQDMAHAVTLDFASYLGYLARYGDKLRELADAHPFPEGAFLHLRAYADHALERLAER